MARKNRASNNIVIPNQCAHWCGNLHRISGYLSSYRSFFPAVFRNSSTKRGTSIRGIATPVCALARNDLEFNKFQFAPMSVYVKKFLYGNYITTFSKLQCLSGHIWGGRELSGKRYPFRRNMYLLSGALVVRCMWWRLGFCQRTTALFCRTRRIYRIS